MELFKQEKNIPVSYGDLKSIEGNKHTKFKFKEKK